MKVRILLPVILFIFRVSLLSPQEQRGKADEFYKENYLRYENHIYKKTIHTVLFYVDGFELSPPVIRLNSDQRLVLHFDDLQSELKNYSFTIVHCDAFWQPSEILSNEYVDGFTEDQIRDYTYSFNTFPKYIHYAAYLPGSSMRFTKTGNYLLKVYQDGNPENLVITRRFMIYDEKLNIDASVNAASIVEDRFSKHEIDFTVRYENYTITNPYSDLKVVLTQNDRWDNAVYKLKPMYMKDRELVFDYDVDNVFPACNEYRYFDIKSTRYQNERVERYSSDTSGLHVFLLPDEKRNIKRYLSMQDINGKYVIRAENVRDANREGDYVYVHFFLPMFNPVTEGDIYVFGALSDWKCNNRFKMQYNETLSGYECVVLLKQGYYNYEYILYRDGEAAGDCSFIEGSHFETEADYTLYIYHRAQGTYYDQLIGVKRLNSARD